MTTSICDFILAYFGLARLKRIKKAQDKPLW